MEIGLKASSNGTLIFSFIGYSKAEQAIQGRIEVKLKPESQTLNEVVVVGYGTQKRGLIRSSL
jgi:hypothetical protein